MPVSIAFCYAREDEALLNKLKAHLKPLQRQNLIDVWYDRDISAGTEWEREICKHLDTAQIILLLVSPDFMNSEYCYGVEMRRAVERHERKETRVIPVILHPVYWQVDPLNKLQALPTDGKPVVSASWYSLNDALLNVTEGIREVVERLTEKYTFVSSIVSEEVQPKVTQASTPLPIAPPVRKDLSLTIPLPVKKWAELRTLTGHTDVVDSLVVSHDGQQLFSRCNDGTIKEWNLSTGSVVRILTGHAWPVSSLAVSRDGQQLFSGSWDRTIKEWDLSTGSIVRTLTGHAWPVTSLNSKSRWTAAF